MPFSDKCMYNLCNIKQLLPINEYLQNKLLFSYHREVFANQLNNYTMNVNNFTFLSFWNFCLLTNITSNKMEDSNSMYWVNIGLSEFGWILFIIQMIIWIFGVSGFCWFSYPSIFLLIISNNLPKTANLVFEL